MLTIDGNAIIYKEKPLRPLLRTFIVLLGLGLAIMVPAPFIIHANWGSLSWTLPLVVFCILFPIGVGIIFVLIGLVSATELRLDPATGRVDRRLRGPIVNRSDTFRLSDIAPPEVFMNDNSDGGPFPVLRLKLPDGRRLDMACFSDRREAELWRDRIIRLLAG